MERMIEERKAEPALSVTSALLIIVLITCCKVFPDRSCSISHLKEVKDDKQNRQETPTTDAILKAKFWMLNEEKSASKIQFPKELVILAKNVKSNAPILHE
jgi:hypothetical protein